jgi:hypothetical protein
MRFELWVYPHDGTPPLLVWSGESPDNLASLVRHIMLGRAPPDVVVRAVRSEYPPAGPPPSCPFGT